MCCVHLSQQAIVAGNTLKVLHFALRSFFLYPKGYNGKTNKIVFVSILYTIPFLRIILKKVTK